MTDRLVLIYWEDSITHRNAVSLHYIQRYDRNQKWLLFQSPVVVHCVSTSTIRAKALLGPWAGHGSRFFALFGDPMAAATLAETLYSFMSQDSVLECLFRPYPGMKADQIERKIMMTLAGPGMGKSSRSMARTVEMFYSLEKTMHAPERCAACAQ